MRKMMRKMMTKMMRKMMTKKMTKKMMFGLVLAATVGAAACSSEKAPAAPKPAAPAPSEAKVAPTDAKAVTPAPTEAKGSAPVAAGRRFEITVTQKGFEPANVTVPKGEPVTLVFTRKTDKTCATEFVLVVDAEHKIERKLPLDQPVEVTTTFPAAGELKYACAMDMIGGVITVQ